MRKTLLVVLFTLFMSAGAFAQTPITFDNYGNVLLESYESYADNQVVKIVLTVSNAESEVAAGWGIGEIVPIGNYEVKNYAFTCKAASAEGAANEYEFTIANLKEFAKVDGEYWIDTANGDRKGIAINVYNGATLTSITVGAAVEPSAVIDFESDEIGAAYESIAWDPVNISAVVANDPAAGAHGKSLHVTSTNWNSYPKFSVILPDGKTVADIEKVKFDLYLGTGGSTDQNSWKNVDWFIGAPGTSFVANETSGQVDNLIASETAETWITKEMPVTTEDAALLTLSTFDFGFGVLVEKADYYLDNIAFILKEGNSIAPVRLISKAHAVEGGIIINADDVQVAVFRIDGRTVKQTIADGNIIPLAKGVYFVKIGTEKAVKVLVK